MGRICGHGFTNWDDEQTLSQNPNFNPPTLAGIAHYWHSSHLSLYIPATYTVWGALAFLSGLGAAGPVTPNPWLFHTASVLLHVGSTLIVFSLLRRWVRHDIAAMLGAAIFAVHPVQVETVAWASGMKDLLCGFFSLLAIWQYVRFVDTRRWGAYGLGIFFLVVAFLSKPTAMVVPVMAVVIDYWLLGRSWRQTIQSLWPWFVLIVPLALSARWVQGTEGTPLTPLWTRPLIYTDAMAFYLGKIFWPMHLALDYARAPVYAMREGFIYWTWIFPAAAAVLVIIFRRRRGLVAGVLLFLVGWLPVSGLCGFLFQYYSTVADHYLYLPMLGAAVIVAYSIADHPLLRRPTALVIVLLAIISFIQAGYWGDAERLYHRVLAVSPRSYAAHANLAMVLLSHNQVDAAEALLVQGTQIDPNYYQAWETLAELLAQRGKTDQAIDAEKHAMYARQFLPSRGGASYPAQLDLFGQLLMKKGRYDDAIEQFKHALQINPAFTPAQDHLHEAEKYSHHVE